MTTLEEQSWCQDYTRHQYSGAGAVVELGCFLGSLTIPLAEGLKSAVKSGRLSGSGHRIHSHDLFYFHHSFFDALGSHPLKDRVQEKEWFFEIFEQNIALLSDWVQPYWTDLGKATWEGGVIELLLLDCMKYDAITNNVLQQFFPALKPGVSMIVQQDYFHFYEWWTHLITFEQRDLLEITEEVPHSGMLVLKVTGDIAAECAQRDPNRAFNEVPAAAMEEAYEWNYRVIREANHDSLTAARIWGHLCNGRKEFAVELYREAEKKYPGSPHLLDVVNYCRNEDIDFM